MKLEELYREINKQLWKVKAEEGFRGVLVEDEDNDDQTDRASIRVLINDYTVERENFCGVGYSANPEIYYFSKNRDFSNEENIQMQEILERLFLKGIEVNGLLVEPDRMEFQKDKGVLYCKLVGMKQTVYEAEEDGEPMEELVIDMKGE